MDLARRTELAESLLSDESLATRVTDAFFSRHPEWEARFGPRGRPRCTEDARHHLSFLAGAVQAGSAEIFSEYAAWCSGTLAARGVDATHLVEYFELLAGSLPHEGDARELLTAMLAAASAAVMRAPTAEPASAGEHTPFRLAYLSAALAGRRAEAWEATREARRAGHSVEAIYRDVLLWTQRRLGELWAAATISVAQEHMASAVTQSTIARLYAEIPGDRTAGRALIAGVEGELHVLPAQLASDLLELEGWDVAFVGTHVPQASVITAIEAEHPDVLGLSTTMGFNLPRTVALATAVRRRFATLPIVLGGRAMRGTAKLGEELAVVIDEAGDGSALRAYRREPTPSA